MVFVTAKQKSDFRELGFVLVENIIPPVQLAEMKAGLTRLWDKAKRKQVGKIRVYDDFPYFLGGVNVAGIEDALFEAPVLADWLSTSRIDEILHELAGWDGAELELARIHMNDRFKYQGFWHRDATVDKAEQSIVAIAYFQDEEGFRIASAASKYSSPELPLGDDIQRRYFYGALDDEHTIAAPAGSVFFMKSYLLHRGYNNKPRLHLHMRFVQSQRYDKDAWAKYRNLEVGDYDFSKSSPMARTRTLVSYCIPRQNRSSLFQK